MRQAVGERRAVEEHELVLAVVAGRVAFDGFLEGVVLVPIVEDVGLQLREARVRRYVRALLAGRGLGIHMGMGGFAHRVSPRAGLFRYFYCHEDDSDWDPDMVRLGVDAPPGHVTGVRDRHRGTTSLAAPPDAARLPAPCDPDATACVRLCRAGPVGSTERGARGAPPHRSSDGSPLITDHRHERRPLYHPGGNGPHSRSVPGRHARPHRTLTLL